MPKPLTRYDRYISSQFTQALNKGVCSDAEHHFVGGKVINRHTVNVKQCGIWPWYPLLGLTSRCFGFKLSWYSLSEDKVPADEISNDLQMNFRVWEGTKLKAHLMVARGSPYIDGLVHERFTLL